MAYDNTNRGALFKAKEKTSENSPGYTGKLNVDGKDYRIAAWLKESDKAGKYFSLSVQPADDKPAEKPKQSIHDMESDIPFR